MRFFLDWLIGGLIIVTFLGILFLAIWATEQWSPWALSEPTVTPTEAPTIEALAPTKVTVTLCSESACISAAIKDKCGGYC